MEPQFKSFLVTGNPDKGVNNSYIVVFFCIIACMGFAAFGMYQFATIAFVLAILVIIVMIFLKKGNIQSHMVSDLPLVLTPDTIVVANKTFRIGEITGLKFKIHSFKGMSNPRGTVYLSGLDNYIEFTIHGVEEYHRFYLNSRQHTTYLCAVLREYYRKKNTSY